MDRKQWFISRIGKRVFNTLWCDCNSCTFFYNQGIVVHDKQEAIDMYSNEILFQAEGTKLKYFDTKEERAQYETENEIKK